MISDYGIIAVHRIAAATEIIIPAVRRQQIVRAVVNALVGNRRSHFIPFRRMIEYHIENDFYSVLVKLLDGIFQFIRLQTIWGRGSIACLGRKETDRSIAPLIIKAFSINLTGVFKFIKFKDRHQFDTVYAQFL